MYCPYCGVRCETFFNYCPSCGKALPVFEPEVASSALPESEPMPATPEVTLPPAEELLSPVYETPVIAAEPEIRSAQPQPAPKGRLWPPLVICAVMITIGLLAFFFLGSNVQDSSMPWFHVEDGVLSFDPSRYTGSEELTIPKTLGGEVITVIGDGCFAYCEELTTVYIPETVTHIEDGAFFGCTALRGIMIPESVVYIGNAAFQTCRSLEAITIPSSVKSMGSSIFTNCDNLHYIIYDGTHEEWVNLYPEVLPYHTEVHTTSGVYAQVP